MAKQNNKTTESKNVEFEELTSTEGFFDKYKNILIYSSIGIVLVLVGILGYQKLVSEPNNIESQNEIYNALYDFEKDSLEKAAIGTNDYIGFEEAADSYNGTSGGDIANYSMGIISMERGEFDVALDYFSECGFDDVMVGSMCIGLQGDCNVELGEYEKAVKLFEKAAAREVNEFTSPMYLKKAGLTYEELGQYDKAIVAYTKIKNDFPQSSEGTDIDKFIARATK
jgi:tetratricopeptide (TPR) repeat protein